MMVFELICRIRYGCSIVDIINAFLVKTLTIVFNRAVLPFIFRQFRPVFMIYLLPTYTAVNQRLYYQFITMILPFSLGQLNTDSTGSTAATIASA